MPYDGRFLHAKNCNGELFRDENTGNRVIHCSHAFVIHPEFRTEVNYHAKFIPLERKTLDCFQGTCRWCGDIIYISADDVAEDCAAQDKILEKALKEADEND